MSLGLIIAANLAQTTAPIVDLIFPPRCPLCGGSIAGQQGLCAPCWSQLQIPSEPRCAACQRPFGGGLVGAGALCAPCLSSPPRHDGIAAATLYNPASRRLVLAFKHGRRIAMAPMLARLIAALLPRLEGDWLIDGLIRCKATPSLGGLGRKARVRAYCPGRLQSQRGGWSGSREPIPCRWTMCLPAARPAMPV